MIDDPDDKPSEEPIEGAEPEQPETPVPETPPEDGSDPKPAAEAKPNRGDRRFAHLQARTAEAQRRAEEAERRAEAAEQLLEQARANGEKPPVSENRVTQAQIRAEAERLVAEQRANEARGALIHAGVEEFTADTWNEKTTMLATMGALQNAAFMETLVDLPEGHRIVVALADDPDTLASLLAKRPAAMASALGRMAAELSVAKEPTKPISRAPAPVKPVGVGRVAPAPDPTKMSAQEYINWRNRTAPKHLGGRGEAH